MLQSSCLALLHSCWLQLAVVPLVAERLVVERLVVERLVAERLVVERMRLFVGTLAPVEL